MVAISQTTYCKFIFGMGIGVFYYDIIEIGRIETRISLH